MKCEMCGKTPSFGHNVSHSKRRTNRMWMPNIHSAKIAVNGTEVRMKLCTRCIRTQAKLAKTA
ncbi:MULTISPECIES: 50S ribosomal protein L28 [Dehalococcoides]|uniref:Large ribosomal subunit protein bL28 n=3 Tax=Dehalococcoides mccartyi TaxID=61435 RepID=A0A142VCG4_9CHLR|nr:MULTISPECIES: 50S ribosomal protein L28 [Dehalococcoides]AGG06721.1 50S ribosomal protein L28 [Dehalococcoides mccartyi DCMB5]AGG08216.1 50S ribosomal protein L28 [Dehalococcoides mccartyi BTF08]AII61220.1 50S ribosomal protein L28 [Dehalococcoides mccartyi CG5]AMU86915.1 50S ribosomal protein L28 [Dehalococcoides mccartyi]AQU06252.1 50S ribosomal protein L28 [Dehalococcoides mccartyi]